MKIKILKENFPNEMPSGPSLGQPGPSNASMPETKRKMMVLIDRIGKTLDEIVTYDNVYDDISASFINLKPAPIIKNFNYVRDENNEKVYRTLEETALERAKTITFRRNATSIARTFKKTISQATTVSELFEDLNQYLQIIESIGVDRSLALYVKDVIYKDRSVRFKNAGAYISKLYNYGDYLAATGLAIESLTKIIPKLSSPGVGLAIKSIAESFTINFKSLWDVITQELTNSGDVLPSRREFMHAIEPEILKHLMKIKKPTSLYDLLEGDFMKKMIEKYPIANFKSSIRGQGTAKVLLRRALYALGKKGFLIMADGSKYVAAGSLDEFVLNPQMVQQAGEEYFPKPETIMEIKMKITKEKIHKLIQEQYELNAKQREKLLTMLTTDVVSAIQALELINTLDIGYAKAGLLGDALMFSGRDYKKRELHDFLLKATEEEFFKNAHPSIKSPPSYKTGKLKEATGEQKRQQKRDAYASRDKQRRKLKARIKRSQNKGEPSYKNERPDFDPIKDIGKIIKQRNKNLQVYANGEEIED